VRGILEAPVVSVQLAREYRADLVGVAAHGHDGRYGDVKELRKVLGAVRGGVEADLLQDFEGHRMDVTSRLRTGTGDIGDITDGATEDGLREMAPAGITGAEDEDKGFAHG
jgi:hypothetical protein